MKVILVDDEEWCLKELSDILSDIDDVEIIGTYSLSAAAIEAVIGNGPDIIFLDVQMPGISGLDLALRFRTQLGKLHIILMSEKECFARNGFDIGVDDYILKPFREERIRRALERAKSNID